MDDFKVSVIIPAFNAEKYIEQALQSVLQQTHSAYEILVVDDGSSDNTRSIAASYANLGVRVIANTHQGASAARNAGVRQAQGNYLAFLDADDYWGIEKLALQKIFLKKHPEVQGVFGEVQSFICPNAILEAPRNFYTTQPGYVVGSLLISRETFLPVGFFSEAIKIGEFIEWYARALQARVVFGSVNEVILYRRIHGMNSVLSEKHTLHTAYLKIIQAKLKQYAS